MARKTYKPEEIIKLLRLVEIEVGKGETTGLACKKLGFTEVENSFVHAICNMPFVCFGCIHTFTGERTI